jgi:predicted tellurium resistance membrane protein TerC
VFGASGHIRRAGRLSGGLLSIFVLGSVTFLRADFVRRYAAIVASLLTILDYIGNGDLGTVQVL